MEPALAVGPDRFGRYAVRRLLGEGAMGAVYLAHDESLGRDVAVKTLRPLGLTGFAEETFRARFANEARAVAALSHPHVVRVFDTGIEGDLPYLVMEVVAGPSLKERLESGSRLTVDEARTLGVQIAGALDAAHAAGIIHRDVKPANILADGAGVWKLADFGVAKVPDTSLTLTGMFLGSPAYAAPEALQRGAFSPASDVYGLAATLREALGGAGLPELERALSPEPGRRPSAARLAAMLSTSTAPPVPRRGVKVVLAVVALAVLIGLVIGASRTEPTAAAPTPTPSATPSQGQRDDKRWRKIEERLADGDYEKAEKELEKLLDKHPEDEEARALLQQLRADQDPGGR